MRLTNPAEAGLNQSIQNYTGHLRSCSVTKDLLGGQYGSTRRTFECWLLRLLRINLFWLEIAVDLALVYG